MGIIPQDWDAVSLAKITAEIGDGIHTTPIYSSNGNYRFINGNNLRDGKIVVTEETKAVDYSEFAKHRKNLNSRSILMSINGTIGNLALFDGEAVVLGKSAAYLNIKSDVSKLFIYHSLQTEIVKRQFSEGMTGSTIGNLGLGTIKNTTVFIPPTEAEQEAIAEALSDADALIASLERLLAKKRNIKQGAMQELLTGKKRLPGFSGTWALKALGDLFHFSGGFTASRDQLSSEGYCYLHYGDIHTSKKSFVDVRSEYQEIPKLDIQLRKVSPVSLLDDGDVVFVDASEDDEGTSKHVVIINPDGICFISGLHTIVAKCKVNVMEHQYRRYCFQTSAVKAQFRFFAVGTKVSGISKANIAKITLPVPSVREQTAIATILSDMDAEIVALEAKLAKARGLKQSMMQELLTGRIRLVEPTHAKTGTSC